MKNILQYFKRKDEMNNLDLIKIFEATKSLLKSNKHGRKFFAMRSMASILITLWGLLYDFIQYNQKY